MGLVSFSYVSPKSPEKKFHAVFGWGPISLSKIKGEEKLSPYYIEYKNTLYKRDSLYTIIKNLKLNLINDSLKINEMKANIENCKNELLDLVNATEQDIILFEKEAMMKKIINNVSLLSLLLLLLGTSFSISQYYYFDD